MSIPTRSSLVGCIVSAPQLHYTTAKVECCRVRVGVEHHRREVDGTSTTTCPTVHDLVAFGKTARETWGRFRPGDRIIASGYIHEYEVEAVGGSRIKEEFVARRIGHDATRTHYEIQRRRGASASTPEHASDGAPTPAGL